MQRLPLHLLALSIGLALAGCAASGESSKQASKQPSGQSTAFGASSQWRSADPTVVQRDIMNFADRFSGSMADTYDELAKKSTSPEAKNAALERKIGNVSAAYVNASEASPVVGLIDMIVMVTLVRQASQGAWFNELYGADAANVVTVLKTHEADIWSIGARYLTESQLAELRAAIDRWHGEHPGQRYVSTVRLADFPEAKSPPPAGAEKGGDSVFTLLFLDPLAGLDPALREVVRSRETAERMFFYAQRMPVVISWQSEALSRRVLELPRVQQIAVGTSRFSDFADTVRRLTDIVGRWPQTFAEERQKTVELVSKKLAEQRAAAVQEVAQVASTEREAALKQSAQIIASERDAAIKQFAQAVADERKEITRVTTRAVASEREAILSSWNASIQSQRQALVSDMEQASGRTVNRVFILAGIVIGLSILLLSAAILLIRRFTSPARAGAGAASSAYKPLRGYLVETGATEDEIRITEKS